MASYHIPHEYQWNYEGDYLPQSYDLQAFDDSDDIPTNVQMADYLAAERVWLVAIEILDALETALGDDEL